MDEDGPLKLVIDTDQIASVSAALAAHDFELARERLIDMVCSAPVYDGGTNGTRKPQSEGLTKVRQVLAEADEWLSAAAVAEAAGVKTLAAGGLLSKLHVSGEAEYRVIKKRRFWRLMREES